MRKWITSLLFLNLFVFFEQAYLFYGEPLTSVRHIGAQSPCVVSQTALSPCLGGHGDCGGVRGTDTYGCFQVDANSATHAQMRYCPPLPNARCYYTRPAWAPDWTQCSLEIYAEHKDGLRQLYFSPSRTCKTSSHQQPRGINCCHFPHLSVQFPSAPWIREPSCCQTEVLSPQII